MDFHALVIPHTKILERSAFSKAFSFIFKIPAQRQKTLSMKVLKLPFNGNF